MQKQPKSKGSKRTFALLGPLEQSQVENELDEINDQGGAENRYGIGAFPAGDVGEKDFVVEYDGAAVGQRREHRRGDFPWKVNGQIPQHKKGKRIQRRIAQVERNILGRRLEAFARIEDHALLVLGSQARLIGPVQIPVNTVINTRLGSSTLPALRATRRLS